jgi:energy-converting hydrogenase Eha subunit A
MIAMTTSSSIKVNALELTLPTKNPPARFLFARPIIFNAPVGFKVTTNLFLSIPGAIPA